MSINILNRYRYTKASIKAAISALNNKGTAPSFMKAHPKAFSVKGSKLFAIGREVIPRETRDSFLRTLLYENKQGYPFGRDSLFHVLKAKYLGISKRDIESFLNSQPVIVARRARPKKEKREFLPRVKKAGTLEGDLAHIRPEDVPADYMPRIRASAAYKPGVSMKNIWKTSRTRGDRYFYNIVDKFTGYLVTEVVSTKAEGVIAKATQRLVKKMAKALGVPVKSVTFDQGTEFFKSQRELDKQGIHTRRVRTNAYVEQTNAKMQRIFYTLVAQKRAGFKATVQQAVDISNNTLNRRTKMTPNEAVQSLRIGKLVERQRQPRSGFVRKRAFKVGTKVRRLLTKRAKTKAGYKAYKGKHFGPIQTITKINWHQGFPKYELDTNKRTKHGVSLLLWHDEVIRARDADKISEGIVAGRNVVLDVKPPKRNAPQKAVRHSKRLKKGSRVEWDDGKKKGVIQKYRGAGRNKEWQVKTATGLVWVKDTTLS